MPRPRRATTRTRRRGGARSWRSDNAGGTWPDRLASLAWIVGAGKTPADARDRRGRRAATMLPVSVWAGPKPIAAALP
eukprot:2979681-Pyramimonas_sp.AAC.1